MRRAFRRQPRYTARVLLPDDADVVARDPALPGLALLLDPEALSARLEPHRALRTRSVEIETLRYRPGERAVASLRLHRPGGVLRAAAWAETRPVAEDPGPGGLTLPAERLEIRPLSDDPRLPGVGTTLGPQARGGLLERLGVEATGLPPDAPHEVLAYRPGRRLTLRLGSPAEVALVLKLYRRGGFRRARERQRWRAENPSLPAQRCAGASPSDACLALAWQPGTPLATRLREREDDLRREARAAGHALSALHATPAPALPERAATEPAAFLALLQALDPEGASAAAALLATSPARESGAAVTLHGDFHAKQVLADGDVATLLDLDDACRGEPAHDLACFSAHLERDVVLQRIPAERAASTFEHFLEAYGNRGPDISEARVRHFTSQQLATMAGYPFRTRRPGWRQEGRALIARARALSAG